jgi:hypothetical protein
LDRKHEKLREVAELAEAKERLEKIWNPRIGDLERYRSENLNLMNFLGLLLSVQAVFYGADSRVDSESIPYLERYDGPPYLRIEGGRSWRTETKFDARIAARPTAVLITS